MGSWRTAQRELDRISKAALVSGLLFVLWKMLEAIPAIAHGKVF